MILLYALLQLILMVGGAISVLSGVTLFIAGLLVPKGQERTRRLRLARPLFFLGLAALLLVLILTAIAYGG